MIEIAFLGAGRMASAMIEGILRQGKWPPGALICTSAADGTGQALAKQTGIHYTDDPATLLDEAQTLVLACKPQQLESIAPTLAELATNRLVLSILAGVPLQRLIALIPDVRNTVRAMPNTPGQIGAGISAFTAYRPLMVNDQAVVETILGALGQVLALPEEQLDAVTALSGSGPAYVFEFVAALRDGGIAAGLPAETAYTLALQTTLGAARLLAKRDESPEQLRDQVVSPGGTTEAGLSCLQERGLHAMLADTIQAAKQRSIALAASP